MARQARVLLLVLLIASQAACGGSGSRGSAAAAESAARSYVEAYDGRDGHAICDAFDPELRRRMDKTASRVRSDCARLISAYIGYGEESDTPLFQHVTVESLKANLHGNEADVGVRESLTYKTADAGRRRRSFSDVIHLLWRDGRWQVVKPGAIYYLSQSAYQVPPTVLDPPITQAEAGRPAPQRGTAPACSGAVLARWSDPPGDAPAAIDLTGMDAFAAPKAICIRIASRVTPPPGTVYSVALEQPAGLDRTRTLQTTVRVGHSGVLSVTSNADVPGGRAGWDGDQLVLAMPLRSSQLDPHAPLHLSARLDSLQGLETLITHPLIGGDVIRGDTFEQAAAPSGLPTPDEATPQAPTLQACVDAWNAHDPGRAPIGYDPFGGAAGPLPPAAPGSFIARTAWVSAQSGLGCSVDLRLGDVHAVFRQTDGAWYGFSFLNPQLWQPPANACQAADGRLTLANSCPAIHVSRGRRRPLLEEYERLATDRVEQATSATDGPVWWLGPRPQTVALATPDDDLAWAAHAVAAVTYTWQEPPKDVAQLPPRYQVVVLTYRRGAAPATLPCQAPCAYTAIDRLDRGDATILLVARTGESPPARQLPGILKALRPLPS